MSYSLPNVILPQTSALGRALSFPAEVVFDDVYNGSLRWSEDSGPDDGAIELSVNKEGLYMVAWVWETNHLNDKPWLVGVVDVGRDTSEQEGIGIVGDSLLPTSSGAGAYPMWPGGKLIFSCTTPNEDHVGDNFSVKIQVIRFSDNADVWESLFTN